MAKEVSKATLTIYRNLPWSVKMRHVDIERRPINLTGWDGKLVVRESLKADAPVFHTFDTADGSMVLGNGTIQLLIPDAATINAFDWEEGVGHLVLKAPTQPPEVQALFTFVVRQSTTDTPA